MKKVIEELYCDVCLKKVDKLYDVRYPVIFTTEQTEGRSCPPYIYHTDLGICPKCAEQVLKLKGAGAQGYNDYSIVDFNIDTLRD